MDKLIITTETVEKRSISSFVMIAGHFWENPLSMMMVILKNSV